MIQPPQGVHYDVNSRYVAPGGARPRQVGEAGQGEGRTIARWRSPFINTQPSTLPVVGSTRATHSVCQIMPHTCRAPRGHEPGAVSSRPSSAHT